MKGNFLLGLNFVFIKLYPMRAGATLCSSLLVNTMLIVIMAPAVLQFCATAFAQYASNSDIFDIFGVQVTRRGGGLLFIQRLSPPHKTLPLTMVCRLSKQVGYLMGISWLYNSNFFLWCMLAIMFISSIIMMFRGTKQWERKK